MFIQTKIDGEYSAPPSENEVYERRLKDQYPYVSGIRDVLVNKYGYTKKSIDGKLKDEISLILINIWKKEDQLEEENDGDDALAVSTASQRTSCS